METNKLLNVSHCILEVFTRKRVKKLLKTILITPINKAMEKLDKPHDKEAFKKSVYEVMDEMLCPEILNQYILTVMTERAPNAKKLLKKLLNSSEDIKPLVEKFVSAVEENAEEIGKIVKKVIVVTSNIIDEVSEYDDDTEDDEENDDASDDEIVDAEGDDEDVEILLNSFMEILGLVLISGENYNFDADDSMNKEAVASESASVEDDSNV